ncbi:MAG: DUF3052 domain-containing protein [Acidobacteriota bacterium]|nr:DUF3052 domain-containing protein [Acidobacteriota bacterium]
MSRRTAGYSGTPLAKKLGITEGCRLYVKNAPSNYAELIAPAPVNVSILKRLSNNIDIVHFFINDEAELRSLIGDYKNRIKQGGMIWVSWPKKSSAVRSDVTEDVIREVVLSHGLVDVKVCAVDETWSGLKLVIRKELRK